MCVFNTQKSEILDLTMIFWYFSHIETRLLLYPKEGTPHAGP